MAAPFLRRHWAAFVVAAIVLVTALTVRLEGRLWFCECGDVRFIIADAWSSHTSQHLFDPYSLTHLQHGLIFYWALLWLAPRWTWQSRLVAATAIEAAWEVVENSTFVINRYREATAALGYEGDAVVNVLGDLFACILGTAAAGRLGWKWSLALLIAIEIGLLLAIRDSLGLNVLMLFVPVEAIKEWQIGR